MQNREWLKIIGILELLVVAIIFAIFLLLFIAVIVNNNPRNGENYVSFFLVLIFPLMIILLAMGLTAYRQHESAIVMQFLGLMLLIGIPLILFI